MVKVIFLISFRSYYFSSYYFSDHTSLSSCFNLPFPSSCPFSLFFANIPLRSYPLHDLLKRVKSGGGVGDGEGSNGLFLVYFSLQRKGRQLSLFCSRTLVGKIYRNRRLRAACYTKGFRLWLANAQMLPKLFVFV
jgi:hypothetical protein